MKSGLIHKMSTRNVKKFRKRKICVLEMMLSMKI